MFLKIPIESERCYLYDEHEDRSIFDHEDSYFYAWEIFDYVSDDFTFFVADNCWDLPSDNCDYCSSKPLFIGMRKKWVLIPPLLVRGI